MFMSTKQFFSLPELMALLAPYLSLHDVSQLRQTNYLLYETYTPQLYRFLPLLEEDRFVQLWHNSKNARALVQNAYHVRQLEAKAAFLGVLYPRNRDEANGSDCSTSQPETKLPTIQFVRLTRLHCSMDYERTYPRSYLTQAHLPPLWLAAANPALTHLCISGLNLMDDDTILRDLRRTLGQLSRLTHLRLTTGRQHDRTTLRTFFSVFCSLPPAIECLQFKYSMVRMEGMEAAWTLRQGPLENLKELHMPTFHPGYGAQLICAVLEICPALERWDVPHLSAAGIDTVASTLQRCCPLLRHLSVHDSWAQENIVMIMDTMRQQYLRTCSIKDYFEGPDNRMTVALQKHSTALTRIRFSGTQVFRSDSIHAILSTCDALEHLVITGLHPWKVAISLEDAMTSHWVCERIQHLSIAVKMGHTRKDDEYVRGGTGDLLEEEQYWKGVEAFYTKIGCLTNLRVLDLKLGINVEGDYGTVQRWAYRYQDVSLPRLLALEDLKEGKRGYMSCLAGLKELRELRGSVYANTIEAKAALGQREMEWIVQHWPKIELVEFMSPGHEKNADQEIPEHLEWLQQQRPRMRLSLPKVQ
ncbi:hypothetical protein BC939DRAFT_476099 [Gamsiella multidivaricata]|uniref:uncharacterized protein n=1 Tax=Gamsiella multidivaricata TaxID=101098 RepID=UPI0022203DA2|nr:uncharacterized protein BC939DRAFT_476099 [Gamsiella multidivaricata]KAG0361389.1 hypothetical protein BGZ54_009110 [Gamsiella multidivaricata]KAI7825653.1 hypothetical protein BC939DRAFT_476099 [Gamsiella multidivaricata]